MHFEHTMEAACTPDELWQWVDEPEKQKQWMPGVLANVATSDGPTQVGSTFRMTIQEGGKAKEYEGEVTAYDRPRRMTVKLTGGSFGTTPMFVDYQFHDLGGRTRLEYAVDFAPKGFLFRVLGSLMESFSRRQARKFFTQLQALAEGRA